jgi:very-short-patch-repair endonuclease
MVHAASTDRAVADIASRQHGLVTLDQLAELGFTRRQRQWRLRTGRWDSPYTGVYGISGRPQSWRSDLLAACLAGDGVASHCSAAALWDLPGGRRDRVELITERWEREKHAGLIVHESLVLDDQDKLSVDGIPATSIERTIFDLCAECPEVVVDMAIDRALGRELLDHDRLVVTEARLAKRGRRGAAKFHRIMARRSDAARTPESAAERRLARALVAEGLPEPVVQYTVRDADGHFVARCDLAYPQWRIVVEYDSVQEHTGRGALLRDSARRNTITALGFTPLVATVDDLRNRGVRLASVIRQIRDRAA